MKEQYVQPRFNLVSDPWISVVPLKVIDKELNEKLNRELSLAELFEHCHQVREITVDIPQQSFAIIRLLEAILYRAYFKYRDPDSGEYAYECETSMKKLWIRLWQQGSFKKDVETCLYEYLEVRPKGFKEGFDLFGPMPFYQIKDLAYTDREPHSVDELIADVPKSKKFLFSLRSQQALTELTLAEAARWLVFRQAYDTAGIKTPVKDDRSSAEGKVQIKAGKAYAPSGVIGTGWCGAIGGVYLEGTNFFETLMLNWVLFSGENVPLFGNEKDLPPWEQPVNSARSVHVMTSSTHKKPTGPVSLLTWQSRRMKLVADADGKNVNGVIASYGDTFDAPDRQNIEMWTSWRESETQQEKLKTAHVPWMPRTHDPAKALWRGFSSLLAKGRVDKKKGDLRPGIVRWIALLQRDYPHVFDASTTIRIHAQGMGYGPQSSTFADSMDDSFDFRPTILCRDNELEADEDSLAVTATQEVILATDKAVNCLVGLIMDIKYVTGEADQNSKKKKSVMRMVRDNLREQAYSELDEIFRQRIKSLPSGGDVMRHVTEWREEVQKKLLSIARSYLGSSERSLFSERGEESIGAAWMRFRRILDLILFGKGS